MNKEREISTQIARINFEVKRLKELLSKQSVKNKVTGQTKDELFQVAETIIRILGTLL